MKLLFVVCLFLFNTVAYAFFDNNWTLDRASLYIENDKLFAKDEKYSSGIQLSALYFSKNSDSSLIYDLIKKQNHQNHHYVSISIGNQIYTPINTETSNLILNEQPYAGWTYIDYGHHAVTNNELKSFFIKLGVIGKESGSENIQNGFHQIINVPSNNGWQHQLNNEIGINFKFMHKFLYQFSHSNSFQSLFVPYYSAELGNIHINASAGILSRFGYNIIKDFGSSSIDGGANSTLPAYDNYDNRKSNKLGFSFDLKMDGIAVKRNIFLDGNTFSQSHSIVKRNITGHIDLGFSIRYKQYIVEFMQTHYLKQYKQEQDYHSVARFVFSYLF